MTGLEGYQDVPSPCPREPPAVIPEIVSWLADRLTGAAFSSDGVIAFSFLLTVAGPLRICTAFRFFGILVSKYTLRSVTSQDNRYSIDFQN